MNCYTSESMLSALAESGYDPCRIFVGGLTPEVQEKHLLSHFSQFGTVVAISIERSVRLKSKGYGYVHFELAQSTLEACRWKTHHLLDQPVSVELARDYNARVSFHQERSSRKVAITGIPMHTDHNQLQNLLSRFGEIEKLYKPRFIPSGTRISVVLMKRREDACKLIKAKQLKLGGSSCMQFKPFDRSRRLDKTGLDSVQVLDHPGRRRATPATKSSNAVVNAQHIQSQLSTPNFDEVCEQHDFRISPLETFEEGLPLPNTPTKMSNSTGTVNRMNSSAIRTLPEEHIPEYRFNLPNIKRTRGDLWAPATL